jgi:hypothetical protein
LDRDFNNEVSSSGRENFRVSYFTAELFLILSLFCFTGLNLVYGENRAEFQTSGGSPLFPDVTLALLVFGSIFVVMSFRSFLLVQKKKLPVVDARSRIVKNLWTIIAETIFQNRKAISLVATIYAVIFAFLDGILIFQPSVDFVSAYGYSSPAFVLENCCGPAGYVPVGLAYFPAQHFGIQLIPISLLIMLLVSILVGINVAFLISSVRSSQPIRSSSNQGGHSGLSRNSFFGSTVGAVFGVFAGCPTCAAAFFLSMIAGSGATAISITIAEFQPVIILVSIPLLVGSIFWQTKSLQKILLGCQL